MKGREIGAVITVTPMRVDAQGKRGLDAPWVPSNSWTEALMIFLSLVFFRYPGHNFRFAIPTGFGFAFVFMVFPLFPWPGW